MSPSGPTQHPHSLALPTRRPSLSLHRLTGNSGGAFTNRTANRGSDFKVHWAGEALIYSQCSVKVARWSSQPSSRMPPAELSSPKADTSIKARFGLEAPSTMRKGMICDTHATACTSWEVFSYAELYSSGRSSQGQWLGTRKKFQSASIRSRSLHRSLPALTLAKHFWNTKAVVDHGGHLSHGEKPRPGWNSLELAIPRMQLQAREGLEQSLRCRALGKLARCLNEFKLSSPTGGTGRFKKQNGGWERLQGLFFAYSPARVGLEQSLRCRALGKLARCLNEFRLSLPTGGTAFDSSERHAGKWHDLPVSPQPTLSPESILLRDEFPGHNWTEMIALNFIADREEYCDVNRRASQEYGAPRNIKRFPPEGLLLWVPRKPGPQLPLAQPRFDLIEPRNFAGSSSDMSAKSPSIIQDPELVNATNRGRTNRTYFGEMFTNQVGQTPNVDREWVALSFWKHPLGHMSIPAITRIRD
ncbi:hypothetical protein B0H16DRAFT_1464129 [Mycena metata]|uniref:Uncharacterized protein n=1 Tax=Mycena metata TaxID=1033252 RepID=A0AAD7IG09_9AGAR|nr:hypothetical protein B0H16DRAFT_1464129 [Mycena metata]